MPKKFLNFMKEIDLNKIKKIHFVGIGGIGISALAQLAHHEGKIVFGTNDNLSPQTLDRVRALGIRVFIGANIKNIDTDTDLIIYSTAWDDMEHDFMAGVRATNIPVLTYFEGLGLFSKNKITIAVSGTHGKTTTTGMLAKVMIDGVQDPTVIVGSVLTEQHGNFVAGKSNYFVVEACEYRRSFLNLHPHIAIITNIDNDHLDYYKDIDDIISAFHEFAMKVPKDGFVVANLSDPNTVKALRGIKAKIINFSQLGDPVAKLGIKVPGEHNRKNAAAVLAVARILGLDEDKTKKALESFSGTWRRFEYKGKTASGTIVYDDYGHHPTEVKATLAGAREKFPNKKIVVVFQPHLYSRTKLLLDDFSRAFTEADEVILAPIYAARELFDPSVTSEMLAEKIGNKAKVMKDFSEIEKYLDKKLNESNLLLSMGAGDIYKVVDKITSVLD